MSRWVLEGTWEHNEMMANPIRHIRFIGYGLTNAWSFMLLFVPLFGAHDSTIVVSGSMLSGALCGPYTAARFAQTANNRGPQGAFVPLCPGRLNRNASLRVSHVPIVARCPARPVAFGLLLYRHRRFVVRELRLLKHTRCGASCGMFVSFRSDFMPRNRSGSDRHLCIAARSASDRVVRAYAPFPR